MSEEKTEKNPEKKVSMFRKMASLFDRKQKMHCIVLAVMILIGGALETLGVSAMIPVVQVILNPDALEKYAIVQNIKHLLHIQTTMQFITVLLVALMFLFIIKNAYLALQTYVQNSFIAMNRNRMISRVLREFLNRPYEEYLGADIPTVFRLTDSDIPNTFQMLLALLQAVTEIVVSVCLCAVLLIISPSMTLFIVVIFLGITLLLFKAMKPTLNRVGRKNQAIQSRIGKWRLQAIYGLKDVKVLHREEFFITNYYESGRIGAEVVRTYAVLNAIPRLLIETIFVICILAFILIYLMRGGDMTVLIPQISAFAVAAIRIMPSANRINTYISQIAYSQPSLDYLYDNLKEEMKRDVNGSVTGYDTTATAESPEKYILRDKIVMDHITFAYAGTDKNIVTDVHMEVKKGQSVGIMGPSGAGKSTMVDILLGLLHAQSGTIYCDDWNIFDHYEAWLAQIGYIPQSIYMVDESIRDNIAFGIRREEIDEDRIWTVLEEAQLKEFVEELPDGLDTTIGDRGVRLSGGQRQRIGIARALYHDPEILVFDEATSALDTDTEKAVMEAINSFRGRKTMVIIAHRLNTIADCDVIYKVDHEQVTINKI